MLTERQLRSFRAEWAKLSLAAEHWRRPIIMDDENNSEQRIRTLESTMRRAMALFNDALAHPVTINKMREADGFAPLEAVTGLAVSGGGPITDAQDAFKADPSLQNLNKLRGWHGLSPLDDPNPPLPTERLTASLRAIAAAVSVEVDETNQHWPEVIESAVNDYVKRIQATPPPGSRGFGG